MNKLEPSIKPKALIVSEVLDDLLALQEHDRLKFLAMIKESDTEWTPLLTKLVDRVITHYEEYYRVISKLIKGNVRVSLRSSLGWPSHLEDPFLWVGGWRPSMAFHLLDFKPGFRLGVGLDKLLNGVNMGEFKDMSQSQFVRVGELQRQTIREEAELTNSLADTTPPMENGFTEFDSVMTTNDIAMAHDDDQSELRDVFGKADDLRLKTLRLFVHILSPIQAVQLFIPAAQLHLKVEAWGKDKEEANTRKTNNALTKGNDHCVFGGFFKTWLREQEVDLEELKSAAVSYTKSSRSHTESTHILGLLVRRVMSHYENHYRVKSESAKQNVLNMINPAWKSLLEQAFLWIGGWRPSTAFHLLYSAVGLQLEDGLTELLVGLSTGDLADLTSSQLTRVNELQLKTIRKERELTEMLAAVQETVADSFMIKLSRVVETTESVNKRVESILSIKEDKFKEIFGKADDLRMKTLRNVVAILNSNQAVHFLIAAAELQLKLHEWGKNRDN